MSLKDLKDVTYYDLNNEINIPKDGKIQLNKDKEALDAFLKENVEPNLKKFSSLKERFDYLIKKQYIEKDFVDKYDFKFIEKIYQYLKEQNFHFKSFMAAYKFYAQYALKTNDGEYYLEQFIDRVAMNALLFADGNEELALDLANEIVHQRYQPATPSFLNAGRKRRGEFVSCFLIQPTDNMNTIGRTINSALQLSRIGGGVGINLSNLRAAGDPIKHIEGAASGVVPVMKLLEDSFSYSNQLGQRQGAGAVYLSVFHPDIISFLSAKKENADEKIRVKTLSLGITVPDKFYELAKNDEDMYLFSPYDVERIYGEPFSYVDITKEYDNMVANDEIKKTKVEARDIETEISKLQQESGYPYIMNIDTANRANPIDGKIVMSNLCSEIMQVQQPSTVDNKQDYIEKGTDVSCNLGSTNIVNLMDSPDFGKSVDSMVRALTFVTDHSDIDVVPSIQRGNELSHSIGLGGMGLHSFLAKNKIEYGSDESVEFTSVYFMLLNYWTLVASNKIARERKETFSNFENSKYADGSYFDKYTNKYWGPKSDKIKSIFNNVFVPNEDDWNELKQDVMKDGIYHQNRLAVAPNGSISYINDSTASLHPIISKVEERYESKTGKIYYPAPYLSNETLKYYKSAYDIDMRKVINIYAAAQEHVDQSLSLTLFMRSTIPEGLYEWKDGRTDKMTTRDLNILRNYAHAMGIKSLYYVRTYTDDNQEVGVNECESCSI
ncbi:class 1b ribonucleoside-diphosphate reductase subunit alpha [Apilactobacillus micheneri]|uniref:Ribonucleoside-diphosphate reductase n=1 Tax=Apilactobacillus micheneri TaxID=1899430 RepID=A0A9Q8MTV0_9LACO|nr:class 1b ribonucleoside-diphosphate reductase subunit alpha [Apilactobacillus micheneri]TPR39277.1 class 1b ribonucleoside-diphosphate reductase subunit alpha [Apilactobacillus micheneri]TPR43251.1 class 1b ribonucleoside-diphosphate reductase subunit alpha [Apilactobacillus micheneri]TPR44035.1 class 1b ribonucleoside-diphosphate reductase subunit alpha [Apilactobacillus micheneri]TPR44499.1 class 1b ribonucleoside-diphosphate reductase subunit alpha [Apilactobacillus micheneri]TPR47778.1 